MAIEFITTEEHMQPITREEKFLAKAAGMDVGTLKPITRKEMFLSQISGGGNGGGSGADLLNADGIIKQEVLPDGFPYESTEMTYVLPVTTVDVENNGGQIPIPNIIDFEIGKTYTVTWDTTDYDGNVSKKTYECIAQSVENNGVSAPTIGNIGALMGGESTGEPFVFLTVPNVATQGVIVDTANVKLVDVSIMGASTVVTPMDIKYSPVIPEISLVELGAISESGGVAMKEISSDLALAFVEAEKYGFARFTFDIEKEYSGGVTETYRVTQIMTGSKKMENGILSISFYGIYPLFTGVFYGTYFIVGAGSEGQFISASTTPLN